MPPFGANLVPSAKLTWRTQPKSNRLIVHEPHGRQPMQARSALGLIGFVATLCTLTALPAHSHAVEPVTVAVADFDYIDPSGRVVDEQRVEMDRLRKLVQRVRQ